jgi:hypothetical protein
MADEMGSMNNCADGLVASRLKCTCFLHHRDLGDIDCRNIIQSYLKELA